MIKQTRETLQQMMKMKIKYCKREYNFENQKNVTTQKRLSSHKKKEKKSKKFNPSTPNSQISLRLVESVSQLDVVSMVCSCAA